MEFKKYYIVGNVREEFNNESLYTNRVYNDHPSYESINYTVLQLCNAGYNTEYFGGIDEIVSAYQMKKTFPNCLFLNFSDGLLQENRKAQSAILLEMLGVPFAGSDALARLMAGNKMYCKLCIPDSILRPKGYLVYSEYDVPKELSYPVIIKPNREGSSLGITQNSLCYSYSDIMLYIRENLSSYRELLLETYIPGFELTCFIIGNKGHYFLNEVILCEYNGERYFNDFIFGIEEKSNRRRKEFLASKILDTKIVEVIKETSQKIFESLNMRDFARIDFRLTDKNELFFIEINGNPVISRTSEIGVIASETGIPYGQIVGYIIEAAEERFFSRE